MNTYIVTVTSADRVGIVSRVTRVIREQGGNILEVSQTVMRGYFTIILAVEFPQPRDRRALADSIAEAGRDFELTVAVIEAASETLEPPVTLGERFILTVLGPDHIGNLHGIAACLARRGVNILDLHARVEGTRFSLIMEAFLPPDLPPKSLRDELEEFGRSLDLEAYVQHENIFLATTEPRPVRVGPGYKREDSAGVPH
jgi:glycine cleavage system transcriptional repressor